MKRKILAALIAVMMVVSLVPMTVSAATTAQESKAAFEAAYANNEVTWNLIFDAVLDYLALPEGDEKTELAAYYASITSLDLRHQDITKSVYSGTDTGSLVVFTGLEYLNLINTGIEDLGGLAGMSKLKELYLSSNNIDEADYGAIVGLPLEVLYLSYTSITTIAPLTSHNTGANLADTLKELGISGTDITDLNALWKNGAPSLPELRELDANNLELTSIAALVEIANYVESLDGYIFNLNNSKLASDPDDHIAALRRLFLEKKGNFYNFGAPDLAKTVEVKFDYAGGTYVSGPTSKTVTETETYGALPVVEKEGYEFVGWHLAYSDLPPVINSLLRGIVAAAEGAEELEYDGVYEAIITEDSEVWLEDENIFYSNAETAFNSYIILVAEWEEVEEEPEEETKPEPKFDMPRLNLRSIVIDTTEGGKTNVASGRCYGALGSTHRLTLTPDEGYEIGEVLVNGKAVEANKNGKISFVVKGNTYVEVEFVEIED